MKKNGMIRKAANSFAGRLLRRLLGEEKGLELIEYVILGMLIAATTLVAAGYLGNVLNMQFAALINVVAAKPDNVKKNATAAQTTAASAGAQINGYTNTIQGNGADVDVEKGGAATGW